MLADAIIAADAIIYSVGLALAINKLDGGGDIIYNFHIRKRVARQNGISTVAAIRNILHNSLRLHTVQAGLC